MMYKVYNTSYDLNLEDTVATDTIFEFDDLEEARAKYDELDPRISWIVEREVSSTPHKMDKISSQTWLMSDDGEEEELVAFKEYRLDDYLRETAE